MTRCHVRLVLFALILLCHASPGCSRAPVPVQPGDRVRLDYREPVRKRILFLFSYTERERRFVAGELVGCTADSVTVRRDRDGAVDRRALAEIDRLSVSAGTRRHLVGGLAAGFTLGALLAVPIGGGIDEMTGEPTGDVDAAVAAWIAVTALGGVVGYLDVSDRWVRAEPAVCAPIPEVTTAIVGGRPGMGLVWRF